MSSAALSNILPAKEKLLGHSYSYNNSEVTSHLELCRQQQICLYAQVRLYAMDATALLPALAGLRPLPGEAPVAAPPGPLQDAAAIRR